MMYMCICLYKCNLVQLILQVLLIGGSTGTMLEALQVVGDGHESTLGEVSSRNLPKESVYLRFLC